MAIDVSGEKIIYGKKPRPIQILNTKTTKCQCDNCANVGHIYKLLYLYFWDVSFPYDF